MPDLGSGFSGTLKENSLMLEHACLVMTGADAEGFLQAQLTSDVSQLDGSPSLSAWCNPKGRVIALCRARRSGDGFRLALPAAIAEAVRERLLIFRFRSRVEIDVEDATAADLGVEDGLDDAAWRQRLIEEGIPYIGDAQSEEFTPHMLNLDLLDAVSFDKGCYPGQEIVARTHYRGATKRRMAKFMIDGEAAAGDKVSDGRRDVGQVVNVHGNTLLAVVPIARADEALFVNGAALTHQRLPILEKL